VTRRNQNCEGCPSGIIGDELGVGRCFLARTIAMKYYDENGLREELRTDVDTITITPEFILQNQGQLMEGFSEVIESPQPRYADWIKNDSKIASLALSSLIDNGDLTHLAECSTEWLRQSQSERREPMYMHRSSILETILDAEAFWGRTECMDYRRF
jgi:hypothetical protein